MAERLHARASTRASIAAAVDYRRAALALLGEHVCSARHAAEAAASTVSERRYHSCGQLPGARTVAIDIRCSNDAALSSPSNVHCAQWGELCSQQCTVAVG